MEKQIRIAILEDQMIARLGLNMVLAQFDRLKVVSEFARGEDVLEECVLTDTDIVILDIGLPGIDGIEVARQLKAKQPSLKVLMLTSHDTDVDILAALAAGADGYCLKDTNSSNLCMAIMAVNEGAAWLDPGIAKRVLNTVGATKQTSPADLAKVRDKTSLSARELEILQLLVEGLNNQQMADKLYLSVETVKTHMRHIMDKLAVDDRTQAAVKAMREGLV